MRRIDGNSLSAVEYLPFWLLVLRKYYTQIIYYTLHVAKFVEIMAIIFS